MQKRNISGKRTIQWILLILVVLQFLVITWFNIVKAYGYWDYDAPLALRHAVEMWKHGIFLQNYDYFSTLETDCVGFFAAGIYLATGSLELGMGLCHAVFNALIIAILYDICRNVKASLEQFLLVVLFYFTPYSAGSLGWVQILYASVAQYEFRVIVMLLLLDLILMCRQGEVKPLRFAVVFAGFLAFNFWTTLSVGNYILCMIMLPFILESAIHFVTQKKLRLPIREAIVLVSGSAVSLIGYLLRVRLVGVSHRNDLNLLIDEKFFENLQNSVVGVFRLFGGMTSAKGLSVFSFGGIVVLIRWVFVIAAFVLIIRYARKDSQRRDLVNIFLAVTAVNYGILIVADSNYGGGLFENRYHILWCVMLVLVLSFAVSDGNLWRNSRLNRLTPVAAVLFLLVLNMTGFQLVQNVDKGNVSRQYEKDVVQYAKEMGVNSIFLYNQVIPAACIRAIDFDVYCASVTTRDFVTYMNTGNNYYSFGDNSTGDGPNILVCRESDYERFPLFMKNLYELVAVERYPGYNVYRADRSVWDGVSGLPAPGTAVSVDFPYSVGYKSAGVQDEYGWLVGNEEVEGFLLWGPDVAATPGVYNITLVYRIENGENASATFDVSTNNGNTVLVKAELPIDGESFTFTNVEITGNPILEFRVWKSLGNTIKVEKIIFERVDG